MPLRIESKAPRASTAEPVAVFRVRTPLLYPLAAAAGDDLAVWPGHATHTVTVWRPDLSLRAHRHVPTGKIYEMILGLVRDGALRPLEPLALARLQAATAQNAPWLVETSINGAKQLTVTLDPRVASGATVQ